MGKSALQIFKKNQLYWRITFLAEKYQEEALYLANPGQLLLPINPIILISKKIYGEICVWLTI
jgi:hypothetical protein